MARATASDLETGLAVGVGLEKAAVTCREIAREQFGLIHRDQAIVAGMTPRAIDYRLAKGEWEVHRHNVYRFAVAASSWHQELFGLHLWSKGGIATGSSAAALHTLRSFLPGPLEIAVTRDLQDPPGVTLARLGPTFELHPLLIEGVPCASVEMTIVRLAATMGVRRAGIALDDALRRRMTTLDTLSTYVEEVAIQGRNGITRTRILIESRDRRHEQVRGESENEMLPFFDGFRLPVAEVDHEIWSNGRLVAIADFAYPSARIDIEADTHSFHDSEADAERDKRRDRQLALLGWTVLRFTRREIQHESSRVIRDIKAQLSRAAPDLLSSSGF